VFSWLRDSALRDAGCVTLVRSANPIDVARGFGGDPERKLRLSLTAAQNLSLREKSGELIARQWVAVRPLGSWTLAVEESGWQGSRPEVLGRVSSGTSAVSLYWNVNGGTRFCYAVGGLLLVAFDAVFPDRREGEDPDCLEDLRADLVWDGPDPVPAVLALAARLTELEPEPRWLAGEFDVVPLEPLAEAVLPRVYPETEALTYSDPPMAWALRHATDSQARAAALTAAQYALRVTGLADTPELADAAGLDKLLAAFLRAARKSEGDPRPGACYWAVTALREASNPLPLAAAFKAVEPARHAAGAFGLAYGELREEVLGVLGNPAPPTGSMGLTASLGPWPADAYAWTSAHWLAMVGRITFLQGLSAEAAARVLKGDPARAATGLPALSWEPVAAIREGGGWAVVVEHHELLGPVIPHEEVTAVTITWSARGRALLYYVIGGQLATMLDPQAPDRVEGEEMLPGGLVDGLRLGPTGTGAAACLPVLLVLAERLTGVGFDPARLDEPHLLVQPPARPLG
jgi:hypothetical protein